MTAEPPPLPRTQVLKACPVCDSARTKHFFTTRDRLHEVPGEFSYHVCETCGSVFQNPMVISQDLHLLYPSEYQPYHVTESLPSVSFDSLPTASFRQRLRASVVNTVRGTDVEDGFARTGRLLSKFAFVRERAFHGIVVDECLPKGNGSRYALDLGCGAGRLMQRLQKVGWEVDGLEWSLEAAELARKVTRGRVWNGDFFEVDLPTGRYQLVVLSHVFEHFPEPVRALTRIRSLLSDNGRAVLFYPNPKALGAKWYRTDWFPWEAPRHLVFPPTNALLELAARAGFSSVSAYTRSPYTEEHWKHSRAYARGEHPLRSNAELSTSDLIGASVEKLATRLGLGMGSEILAVLNN